MASDATKNALSIIVLTLERHADGIWIEKLIAALEEQLIIVNAMRNVTTGPKIKVVILEQFLSEPHCVSLPSSSLQLMFENCIGIVNRVSDAAEPWEVKGCLAILQLAKNLMIPTINGPDAYSLCVNKWCHHVIFQQANLSAPTTILSSTIAKERSDKSSLTNDRSIDSRLNDAIRTLNFHQKQQQECGGNNNHNENSTEHLPPPSEELEFLIKPNAGGFGVGISKHRVAISMDRSKDLRNCTLDGKDGVNAITKTTPVDPEDKILLLQAYLQPQDGKFYRVWFLNKRVQCGVQRDVVSNLTGDTTSTQNEFTSGCTSTSSGACSNKKQKRQQTPALTSIWTIPDDVKIEIEKQLLPTLPKDAHCGSVEFLYHGGERHYFDLNLLSTLPIDSEHPYWNELAQTMLMIFYS